MTVRLAGLPCKALLRLERSNVADIFAEVGPRKSALVGRNRLPGLVRAVCYRNGIDSWTPSGQRYRLGRPAVVRQAVGGEPGTGIVSASCGAEIAR